MEYHEAHEEREVDLIIFLFLRDLRVLRGEQPAIIRIAEIY